MRGRSMFPELRGQGATGCDGCGAFLSGGRRAGPQRFADRSPRRKVLPEHSAPGWAWPSRPPRAMSRAPSSTTSAPRPAPRPPKARPSRGLLHRPGQVCGVLPQRLLHRAKTHITVKWEGQEAVQYVVDLSGVQTPAVKLTGVTVSTTRCPPGSPPPPRA